MQGPLPYPNPTPTPEETANVRKHGGLVLRWICKGKRKAKRGPEVKSRSISRADSDAAKIAA
jgi:hypothetical protein